MRISISCSRHIFICFGRKGFRLTINQRLRRDSLALSGHAAVGFEWVLSSQFVIFIHQPHLFTADLHRHTDMLEVPQEIFILRDGGRGKLMSPTLGSSVLNLTQLRNRAVTQFVSCSPVTGQPEGKFISLTAGACAPIPPSLLGVWRLWENPWSHRHQSSCVPQCDLSCMPVNTQYIIQTMCIHLCSWNPYNFINLCHPNRFNKIFKKEIIKPCV